MSYAENASCTHVTTEDIGLQPLQTNKWTLFTRKEDMLKKTCCDEISKELT